MEGVGKDKYPPHLLGKRKCYERGLQVDFAHPCFLPGYLGELVGENEESIVFD
jgi:hypothetical protein